MDASRNYHVSKLKNKFMRKLNYIFSTPMTISYSQKNTEVPEQIL